MTSTLVRMLLDGDALRYALDHVLEYLVLWDVTRLALAALEHGDDRFEALMHRLLDGAAPCMSLDPNDCLRIAVTLGCWHAAERLSLRVQRLDNWHQHHQHAAVQQEDSALHRVMIAVAQSDFSFGPRIIATVAAQGDLEAVRYMLAHDSALYHGAARTSAMASCAKAAREIFHAAAVAQHHHISRWLLEDRRCGDPQCALPRSYFLLELASCGDLEALKVLYLRGDRKDWSNSDLREFFRVLAQYGHIIVLDSIERAYQCRINPTHLRRAAAHGQLEVLEWLWARQEMRNTPVEFVLIAVQCGRLDVLRWLREHLDEAAWKREEASAFLVAARDGDWEILRFFHEERGLQIDASFLHHTMKETTSVKDVEYLLGQVNPSDIDGAKLVTIAAGNSNIAVVQYLVLERGYWSRDAFPCAVKSGQWWMRGQELVPVLKLSRFLYGHAIARATELATSLADQVDFEAVQVFATAIKSDFETAQWLVECVPEVDTGETLADAGKYDEWTFPVTPAEKAFIRACLRARPGQCRHVPWLPRWAAHANCFGAFAMLVDMDHPNTAVSDVCLAVTQTVRDSRFMLKLLAARGVPTGDVTDVLRWIVLWAAKIGAKDVLTVLDRQRGDALRTLGRPELLHACLLAVQHGHVGVIKWFLDRELMAPFSHHSNQDLVEQLVEKAVQHDRAECLYWLVETLVVPTSVVTEALRAVSTHSCPRVIPWLLRPRTAPESSAGSRPVTNRAMPRCQATTSAGCNCALMEKRNHHHCDSEKPT